ncbi:Alpha/Beta hydrolase protein [Crepidotus variabilis]|uniref:Alpha/Beta hydrolase protein n=1 Tax=Crepidotus variabilis TaxID=179855 RepID=A0A9P6EIX9_9AGAR|nr:Alpha/Beta hydrolase protein [Crepidotus variabilis]
MSVSKREFGKITTLETLGLIGVVLTIPIVQLIRLLGKPFSEIDRQRTWRRVKADAAFGHLTTYLNTTQVQFVDKSTEAVIKKWAGPAGIEIEVEKVDAGAQLLWFTPKSRKRVVMYIHGGGYLLPAPPFAPGFWKLVADRLNEKGKDVSLAALEYTLVPKATFPTQLRQGVAALNHLIAAGYSPEDIHIVSDSAGAGLALQVLSHVLHPLEGIPNVNFGEAKLGSLILISPYSSLEITSPTFTSNATKDIFPVAFFKHLGDQVKDGIPDAQRPYIESGRTPEDWFVGVDKYVKRALITCGANECLRHDIEVFNKKFSAALKDTKYITSELGTHNEPYGHFLAEEPTPGDWPILMSDWLADSMA